MKNSFYPLRKNTAGVALIAALVAGLTWLQPVFALDKIPATWKTYSSGWYDFSFRYPEDSKIRYGGNVWQSGTIMNQSIRVTERGQEEAGTSFKITMTLNDPEAVDDWSKTPNVKSSQSVTINGVAWTKYTYASLEGNLPYQWKGFVWITQRGPFTYTVVAPAKSEKLCEEILTTLKFEADPGVPGVEDSAKIKSAAAQFVLQQKDAMDFIGGAFLKTSPSFDPAHNDPQEITSSAVVNLRNKSNGEVLSVLFYKNKDAWALMAGDSVTTEGSPLLSSWSAAYNL